MPPPRRRKAEDVLLSLPTDALDEILSRVGLRSAVRTSVLSRAWTRRWESLPSIDLAADDRGTWKAPSAVDSILLRFPGRVRRFHVTPDQPTARRVNDWLAALSRRGVESLSLQLPSSYENHYKLLTLHESIFSCSRLTVLDFSTCRIPYFPLNWGFPNLRTLILSGVYFQEDGQYQLQEIIETCRLLEDLRLIEVYVQPYRRIELVIRAPSLRCLTLCSVDGFDCILHELPRLQSAAIDMWNYVDTNFDKLLARLDQATNLQLCLCTYDGWYLWSKIPRMLPCTFHNLKNLKLHMDFSEPTPIELIFLLLKSAPNLQILKIELNNTCMTDGEWEDEENNTEFLNAQWEDGMCASLQVVHMDGVYWLSDEVSFMQLILSKARLLRTLSVGYVLENTTSRHAIESSKRASPQAQVIFKGTKAGEYYNMRPSPCIAEEV